MQKLIGTPLRKYLLLLAALLMTGCYTIPPDAVQCRFCTDEEIESNKCTSLPKASECSTKKNPKGYDCAKNPLPICDALTIKGTVTSVESLLGVTIKSRGTHCCTIIKHGQQFQECCPQPAYGTSPFHCPAILSCY
jgi:hypothetical protein